MNDLSKDDSEMWHPLYYPKNDDLSKEEILKPHILNDFGRYSAFEDYKLSLDAIKYSMQEYADQQAKKEAIAFKDFCDNNADEFFGKNYTTEQLYSLYIQSKQQ